MRIAIAVVVGVAMLGGAAQAMADDAAPSRSEILYCSERCETDYSSCMRRRTGKGTEDCPGTLMRCRGTCDPTGTTTRSAAARRLSCPDACQADYDSCIRVDDGKHGQACAKNVMVCRKGCPGEPSRAVGVTEPSTDAPTVSHSKVPSSGSAEPRRMSTPPAAERGPASGVRQTAPPPAAAPSRVETPSAANRPDAPTGATPPRAPDSEKAGAPVVAPAPPPPHVAAAEAPAVDAPPLREAPPPLAATDDTAPSEARRARPSMWSRVWCAATGSCGATSAAAARLSCPDACVRDYDTCVAHEDPKRGGACATESVRCKQRCGAAAAP